jgi:hypothetical protein
MGYQLWGKHMSLNANAILTMAETKRFLDIPEADADYDPDVEDVINTISQLFATETRRDTFVSSAITEDPEGDDDDTIWLRNIPIIETASSGLIWIDEAWADGDDTKFTRATDYHIHPTTGKVTLVDEVFPSTFQSIKVTYYGGYSSASTVPADLKWAAKEACQVYWKRRHDGRSGVTSVSTAQGGSVSYEEGALPKSVTDVLARYRRW